MPTPPWTPEEEASLAALSALFPRGHPRWSEEKWVDCFFMGRFRQTGRTVQDLMEWGTTTEEWDDNWASASQAGDSLHPLNFTAHSSLAHPRPLSHISTASSARLLERALNDSVRNRERESTPFLPRDSSVTPPSPPRPADPSRSTSRDDVPSGRYCAPPSAASTVTHVSATPTPSRQLNNSPPTTTEESSLGARRSIAGDIITDFSSAGNSVSNAVLLNLQRVASLDPAKRDRIFAALDILNSAGLGTRGAAANTRPGGQDRFMFVPLQEGQEGEGSWFSREGGDVEQQAGPTGGGGSGGTRESLALAQDDKASTVVTSPRSGQRRRVSTEVDPDEPSAQRLRTKPPTPPSPTTDLPSLQKAASEVSRAPSELSKAPSEAVVRPIVTIPSTRVSRPSVLTASTEPRPPVQHASPPSPVSSLPAEPAVTASNTPLTSSPVLDPSIPRPITRNTAVSSSVARSTSPPPGPISVPAPPPATVLQRASTVRNPCLAASRRLHFSRTTRASASPAPEPTRPLNPSTRATSAGPTTNLPVSSTPATSSPLPPLGPAPSLASFDPPPAPARQPTRPRLFSLVNPPTFSPLNPSTFSNVSDSFRNASTFAQRNSSTTRTPISLARPPPPNLPSAATARASALRRTSAGWATPAPFLLNHNHASSDQPQTRPPPIPSYGAGALLPSGSVPRTIRPQPRQRHLSPSSTSTASSITDLPLDPHPPPPYRPHSASTDPNASALSFVSPEEVQVATSIARRRSARLSAAAGGSGGRGGGSSGGLGSLTMITAVGGAGGGGEGGGRGSLFGRTMAAAGVGGARSGGGGGGARGTGAGIGTRPTTRRFN